MELDVFEGLAGAAQRDLAFGRAIRVVVGSLGRATLGDVFEVVNREGAIEAALLAVELWCLELHELRELYGVRKLTLDHGCL